MKRVSLSSIVLGSLFVAGMAGCGIDEGAAEEGQIENEVKVLRAERPIPGEYIVAFRATELGAMSASAVAQEMAASVGAKMIHSFDGGFKGFAAQLSEEGLKRVAADPRVAYIEENGLVQLNATQTGAPWGLDRIDQRSNTLNGTYIYTSTGTGVHAYIIDTGIRRTHSQFTGRMSNGFDAVTSGGTANDCNGHGTHVAGTVAGTTYGVAKRAILHPVRVLDCNGSGSYAGVIAGINWVTQNRIRPAVANMSLGGGFSQAVNDATTASIAAGVSYAVAAGNSSTDACTFSPASTPNAVTVGATASNGTFATYSNRGACVDILAPGSAVLSAWYTSDTATATLSGTSMASPHVAGAMAKYLQTNTAAAPATVTSYLNSQATLNAISGVPAGTVNRLLYNIQ